MTGYPRPMATDTIEITNVGERTRDLARELGSRKLMKRTEGLDKKLRKTAKKIERRLEKKAKKMPAAVKIERSLEKHAKKLPVDTPLDRRRRRRAGRRGVRTGVLALLVGGAAAGYRKMKAPAAGTQSWDASRPSGA